MSGAHHHQRASVWTTLNWGRLSHVGLPLAGAVVAISLWWLATIVFDIRSFFLPSPPDIVKAFVVFPAYLLEQAWVTMTEVLIGFGIAIVGGIVIAVILSASKLIQQATLPLLVAVNAIPKLALAPLLLLWIGFGTLPKIILVVLISFFPIVVAAMTGLASTPSELGELSRSLSASWWQSFVKVRLPWALPQMFIGLKVAVSLAVIGAVVAEFSGGTNQGLGFVIIASGSSADTPLAFAAISLLGLMSMALFYLIVLIEWLLLPWARETTE